MQPFATQNRKLAEALALAGCRWASLEESGPTLNLYTSGFLRDRKLLPDSPVSMAKYEAAALDAERRRIPGIVTYFFIKDETFRRAESAWQAVAIELQRADLASEPAQLPDIPPEVVAQVMCIAANSAKTLATAPFINRAWVTTMAGSRASDRGSDAAYSIDGKGKAWPLNATPETRAKLGV